MVAPLSRIRRTLEIHNPHTPLYHMYRRDDIQNHLRREETISLRRSHSSNMHCHMAPVHELLCRMRYR